MKQLRLVGLGILIVLAAVRCQQASHSSAPPKAMPGATSPTGGGGDGYVVRQGPPPPTAVGMRATGGTVVSGASGGSGALLGSSGSQYIPTDGDGDYVRNRPPARRVVAPQAAPAPDVAFGSYQDEPSVTVNWFAGLPNKCDICECNGRVCIAEPPPRPEPAYVPPPPPQRPAAPAPAPRPQPQAPRGATPMGPYFGDQPSSGVPNLDVIFVPHTTASMDSARVQLVSQVDKFIALMPRGSIINFGILPAHCIDSAAYRGNDAIDGELFRLPNEKAEYPGALSTSILGAAKIKEILTARMNGFKLKKYRDPFSNCKGQTGLAGVFKTLYDPVHGNESLNKMVAQGMYRNDAALLLVFLADKADACFFGGTGPSASNPDDIETRKKYCLQDQYYARNASDLGPLTRDSSGQLRSADGRSVPDNIAADMGKMIDVNSVAQYLVQTKTYQGAQLPIIVAPFVYTSTNGPREAGHGYLELNEIFGGPRTTLGTGNLGSGLLEAGNFAKYKMVRYPTSISIQPEHIGRVARGSVEVGMRMANGALIPITKRQVHLDTGVVNIAEADVARVAAPGSQLYIKYKINQ